jgi:CDP-glucose 4,6-dehydratase
MPNRQFWQGKRVLLTGHTGFKGAWLALWLQRLGANVTGVAQAPPTSPNLFRQPRSGRAAAMCVSAMPMLATRVRQAGQKSCYLAAQALVRPSYRDPLQTFSTNIMGTAHVLDALRGSSDTRVAVMVTTDKVYRNLEHPYPYREDDTLGGHDPYSASKAASELVIASYRDAFLSQQGLAVASARAGNVIGGGDWAETIIPNCCAPGRLGKLAIRRQRHSPWQHVLEPLAGYLRLAQGCGNNPAAGLTTWAPTDEAATVKGIEMARNA